MKRDVFLNGKLLIEDKNPGDSDYCWDSANQLMLHHRKQPDDVFIVHTYFLGLRIGSKQLPLDAVRGIP